MVSSREVYRRLRRRSICAVGAGIWLILGCSRPDSTGVGGSAPSSEVLSITNAAGVTMRVAEEHSNPTLWLSIPGEPSGQNAILILLPEHVTVRKHGSNEGEHLYLWGPGKTGSRPNWVRTANALHYETELAASTHFLAQATLEEDGLLMHYEFVNRSDTNYDSVQAITDPRMVVPLLHDERLERTYVHHPQGFVLLASDMPERLTIPLAQWLQNRYRASYSWPVEKARAQKQPDGITFLNASERPDEPVLATVSTDHRWIVATFSRNPGNLWTNPELTCQHADPEVAVRSRGTGILEEKILLFPGTLDDVLTKVHQQRTTLK
jgi:hypothetical protein